MIVEFSAEVIEKIRDTNDLLYKKVLKRLDYIIKGISCESYSNFLYLSDDFFEVIEDDIQGEYGALHSYKDNTTEIESIIANFQINAYVYTDDTSPKDGCLNLKLTEESYEKIFSIISDKPNIYIENLRDREIYEKIAKKNRVSFLVYGNKYENGNGGDLPFFLENYARNNSIFLVITDRDHKYPEDNVGLRESTSAKVGKLLEKYSTLETQYFNHLNLKVKNIEGLYPFKKLCEISSVNISNSVIKTLPQPEEWFEYYDVKKGMKKNIKTSKGKVIEVSKQWWERALKQDFLHIVENDDFEDMFKSGYSSFIDFHEIDLLDEDLLEVQKEDYIKIGQMINNWSLLNNVDILEII